MARIIEQCTPGSFCDETHYPVSLFDLVLNIYAIPLNHAGFAPLRKDCMSSGKETLPGFTNERKNMTPKIFISYSHKDEKFKDELVKDASWSTAARRH